MGYSGTIFKATHGSHPSVKSFFPGVPFKSPLGVYLHPIASALQCGRRAAEALCSHHTNSSLSRDHHVPGSELFTMWTAEKDSCVPVPAGVLLGQMSQSVPNDKAGQNIANIK